MNVSSSLGVLFAVGLTSVPALASAADQASMPPVTVTAPAPSSSRQTPDTNNSSGVSTNPNANTPGQTNLSPLPLQPSLPPDSGLFPGLGRTLLDHGFDFHGLVADHFVDNSGAGAQPGNKANLDIVRLELDVDLSKAMGLKGGYVHVADTWFWGRDDVSKIVLQTGGAIDGYQTTPVAVANVPGPKTPILLPTETPPLAPVATVPVVPETPAKKAKRKVVAPAAPVEVAVALPPPPPPVSLGELSAEGGSTAASPKTVMELILANEKRLNGLPKDVREKQKAHIVMVRNFQVDARKALLSGDVEGAMTLATKAGVLLDEIAN